MSHKAIRHGDQMQCATCGRAWGVKDQDPPECVAVVHVKKGTAVSWTTTLPDRLAAQARGRAVGEYWLKRVKQGLD